MHTNQKIKIMEQKSANRKLFTGRMILVLAIFFSSCEKNDIDPSGSINLKVVNAAPGAGAQNFTLADKVLVAGGLNFANATDYIVTNSGNRLVAQFKTDGTNSAYATGELYLGKGLYYSVYLAGEGSTARVKVYKDDLSAPANGKASVRFIHLSDAAPSDINIKKSTGENLVTNISRNIESGYSDVDPGTLSIKIYGTALRDNIANFDIAGIEAGKIYTLYLTDSGDATLSIHRVQHNYQCHG
jgi:hypothetical protein